MGDKITHINGHSVVNAFHDDIISAMGEAAAHGEVVLRIQRKMSISSERIKGKGNPPHEVGFLSFSKHFH